jgi:hypothetical protein
VATWNFLFIFLMAVKILFFGHNSVNFESIYVLSFATSEPLYSIYFIEDKFLVRFKMTSEIQNGVQVSMSCNFVLLIFFKRSFALCLCKKWEKIVEEMFVFCRKMAPLAQWVSQKWFFYHNFECIQLCFNLIFALSMFTRN